MDFTLRRAQPTDLDAVMALETAGFVPGIVEDRGVFAHRIAVFPEGFLLAQTPEGQPYGYLCAEIWSGWAPPPPGGGEGLGRFDLGHNVEAYLDRNGDTLYVASMTVAPGFRGGGTGRRFFRRSLDQLLATFPGVTNLVLIVNEHWAGARALYLGEGFVEAGALPGFFEPEGGPIGAAVLMVRPRVRTS